MLRTEPLSIGPTLRAQLLRTRLEESIRIRQRLLGDSDVSEAVEAVVGLVVESLDAGGKVLLCGNGGSAADAQHLAAELVGRFCMDRRPLPAMALADNVAALTAISNDYAYQDAYARAVRAFGRPGDVLIGLSTSGSSANVVRALESATAMGLSTVAFVGGDGSPMEAVARYTVRANAPTVASVQEVHKLIGHVVFELVERELCA